jgi:hypothetical protein
VIIKVLWGLGRGLGGVCSRERMRIGGRVQSAGGGFRRGCGMDGHVTIAMVGFTWAWRMGWSREFKVKMSRVQ